MSEAERKKRLSYKENRKRWIFIQGVALIVVAVLIFASVITYNQLNKEYYKVAKKRLDAETAQMNIYDFGVNQYQE